MTIASDSLRRGAFSPQHKMYTQQRMDGIIRRHVSAPHMRAPRVCAPSARRTAVPQRNTYETFIDLRRRAMPQRHMPVHVAPVALRCMDSVYVPPKIPLVTPAIDERSVIARCIDQCMSTIATYRAALRISLSPQRMYQVSMAGAMIVGMVSMSMIYRNLGSSAFADTAAGVPVAVVAEDAAQPVHIPTEKRAEVASPAQEDASVKVIHNPAAVAPATVEVAPQPQGIQEEQHKEQGGKDKKSVDSVKKADALPNTPLAKEAKKMVNGYPIEKMLPYILQQDPEVAKYLIAIAKQESQWGKRVPKLDGKDCYNYWGYRAQRARMGTGGHTCFDSPQDAVETVGKRLHTLIYQNQRTTAKKLIVWKCGSTCEGHAADGVNRWIDVVSAYHGKLSKKS